MPILALFAVLLSGPAQAAGEAAILVPGTLNSFVPGGTDTEELRAYPYFSRAVVETVAALGYEPHVVRGLAPTGGLEANGRQVLEDARAWYLSRYPRGDVPITLIGHSAGGLYALYAAANRQGLPIRKVILVSSPLEGARLANFFLRGGPAAQRIWDELLAYRPFLDLSGLRQMRPAEVAKFLAGLRLDPAIRLLAVGGFQPVPRGASEYGDPDFLSFPFALAGRAIAAGSDGIVETDSAYGRRARILDTCGDAMEITRLISQQAGLEHSEQFMDYRLLGVFGTRSAWVVEGRQRAFYDRILRAAQ